MEKAYRDHIPGSERRPRSEQQWLDDPQRSPSFFFALTAAAGSRLHRWLLTPTGEVQRVLLHLGVDAGEQTFEFIDVLVEFADRSVERFDITLHEGDFLFETFHAIEGVRRHASIGADSEASGKADGTIS